MPPKIYYPPRWYTYPDIDVLSLLFDPGHALSTDDSKLHIDATNPSNHLTKASCLTLLESLAYTLRHTFQIGSQGPYKDVVVGFSNLQIMLPIAFYGTIAAGGVFSTASHSFTAEELARQIEQGEGSVVICSEDLKGTAVAAARLVGWDEERVRERVLVLESEVGKWGLTRAIDGEVVWQASLDVKKEERLTWKRVSDPEELAESIIGLLYSSGTTGVPKAVMLSHRMVVSQVWMSSQAAREWAYPRVMMGELTPSPQRTLAHLPAAHIAGVLGYFIAPVYSALECYWMKKYTWKAFLEHNKTHAITGFFTVPAIWARIAKSPDVADHFDSLEGGLGGAAPLDANLQKAAGARSNIQLAGTYGMSETTGSVLTLPRGMPDDTGSVGIPHANCVFRLVDDDGNDVPEGEPGELLVQTPTMTRGYYKNPKATKAAFVDGWYCTGDILQQRGERGLWYVTDRKKELIKYKGIQVAPAEIEGLLLAHPLVEDAAVIGVQDDREGTEVPRAYVVADKRKISAEDIKQLVKGKLSNPKQLRGGVVFIDEIPRSTVGKILRKDLRELAKRMDGPKL